ncbi:MAG: RIP metalloprotease [Candidatus Dormibacteria bacterium]
MTPLPHGRVASLVTPLAALFTSGLDIIKAILATALIIVVVVVVHEAGHFIVGKLSGVRVDEFSVGFGPKLASTRRGETLYALRAIPAGGFVRLAGMTGLENDGAGERSFFRASVPKRVATIAAGGLINLVLAGLLFGVLAAIGTGSRISPGGAAAAAGLHDGDTITAVNGTPVRDQSQTALSGALHQATEQSQGAPIRLSYRSAAGATRDAEVRPLLVLNNSVGNPDASSGGGRLPTGGLQITEINGAPVTTGDPAQLLGGGARVRVSGHQFGSGEHSFRDVTIAEVRDVPAHPSAADVLGKLEAAWRIGFSPGQPGESLLPAIGGGFVQIPSMVAETFTGIHDVSTTPNSGGLTGPQGASGPVGIFQAIALATQDGWIGVLSIAAVLSFNLGLINLLPIPFLDGGRLVFIVIEGVRHRRVDPRKEALVHAAGLALVVSFALYITIFGDVTRLFKA